MLKRIHESDLGINKCKQRARELLFSPGMSSQTKEQAAKCDAKLLPIQTANVREPMILSEGPRRPWEIVGCDLLKLNGCQYLLCIHY